MKQQHFTLGSSWVIPPKEKLLQFFPQESKIIFQLLRLEDYRFKLPLKDFRKAQLIFENLWNQFIHRLHRIVAISIKM